MIVGIDSDIEEIKAFDFTEETPSRVWTALSNVIKSCLLPEQSYGADRPAEEADFELFRKEIVFGLNSVCNFFTKFVSSQRYQNFDRETLVWTLILCGEHVSCDLWTTDETRNLSASCVKALCSFYGCVSVSQLLLGHLPKINGPCFKQALLILRPKLLQDTWRKHPAAVASYKWLLFQVHSPNLSEYVDVVSPTALIIVDDHNTERRLLGLHCMTHIIDNVARTELCQRGLHRVFYKTLEPMLWQRTASQVEPVLTCLTKLLSLTERGYTRSSEPGMWDLFDDTLSTLIDKMVLEDQIPLRLVYIKSLAPLILAMGPSIIRWSKPLSSVFDEYLHKDSYDTRKPALEAFKIFLSLSTTRLAQTGDNCLYLLLRTLQDVSSEEQATVDTELLHIIKECIGLIQQAAPEEFQSVSQEFKCLPSNDVMRSILCTFC